MVYLCFDPDTLFFNRKTKGFDVQEKLVYQIIEEAGNKGDWIFLVIIYFVNYCLHHFLFLHQACWTYQYVGRMSYMNLVHCMTKSWVLRSSVVGASDQCLEGLRFNYCRGIRFFLCPVLLTFWLCHFSKILTCYFKIPIRVYGHKSLWHSLGIYRYLD